MLPNLVLFHSAALKLIVLIWSLCTLYLIVLVDIQKDLKITL